jgi:hypothetical protein
VLTLLTSIPLALVVGVLAPATSALADEDDGAADGGSSATDSGGDPAADDAFGGSAGGVVYLFLAVAFGWIAVIAGRMRHL